MVIKFPPRFLHPERSIVGREILRLVSKLEHATSMIWSD